MTRVFQTAALLCVAGVVVASAALANVPDPAKSTLSSSFISVEGATSGNPDNCSDGRCGNFTVTVKDFANNVIAGSTVVIEFSGCPDIQVACDQLNGVTGQSNLAGKKVSGTTNASGQFIFKVQGASNASNSSAPSNSPGTNIGVPCAQVYADGVPIGSLIVDAYDLNGLGSPTSAVNSADVSLMFNEVNRAALLAGNARARHNYDHNGALNAADVSIMLNMALQAGLGTGSQKTGPYCP